jgi:hypothetical protein
LKSVSDLFRFGRYRPKPGGAYKATAGENTGGSSSESEEKAKKEASSPSGTRGGSRGDIYALFADENGVASDLDEMPVEPQTRWVIVEDGSRSQGDLEDRAARFLPDQNLLLINGDFRAFTDMIDRWADRYSHVPGCRSTVQDVTREWFEQQLIETVMSALALKNGGKWSKQELGQLWDDAALTAAVLPRYHIDMNIKRVLGQRLRRIAQAA